MLNVNKRNNQFSYASKILDISSYSSSSSITFSSSFSSNTKSNITSIPFYNKGTPKLYSTITSCAHELADIAELTKEETERNVRIEEDINTMKRRIERKQGSNKLINIL